MQTLIKWPGGKSKEFEYIEDLIPPFERFVEPFFGGGAVFFKLQPKKAIINDIAYELIEFYKFVKGENDKNAFKKELYAYVDNWEKIPEYIAFFENKFIDLYARFKDGKISKADLVDHVHDYLIKEENYFNGLFSKKFSIDERNLLRQINANLISKLGRTKDVETIRGLMKDGDLHKNIETAFRSGFYMHFRDIMNYDGSKYTLSLPKKIANYYFIREFCYGAMFRFNAQGNFNIPYGGIAYNSKNFRGKVDAIFSEEAGELFRNTTIYNADFNDVMQQITLTKDDFMFLDPPYDTDFSDYEKKTFDKKDQERLANVLYKTKAKFILIIKNTPFILNLYKGKKGLKIESFEKKYLYNVKGRNDRNVEHLIIYNY